MKIARNLLNQIIEHARRDAPNECCGVVGARDGDATSVHEMENLRASALAFEMDGPKLVRVIDEIEDAGSEHAAIYHSHTRTPPYPSQTDINYAANWPGLEWIIVGLDGDDVTVRSFLIEASGRVDEVPVEVT